MTDTVDSTERRVAFNAGSRYAALAVTTAIRFFLTPFLIHTVGRAMYGLMTLSAQAMRIISLGSAAITMSYTRFATAHYARGEHKEMNAVLSCGFRLAAGSAGIIGLGALCAIIFADVLFDLEPPLLGAARAVMAISGTATVIGILVDVWVAPVFMQQRFYLESVRSVLANTAAAACVVTAFRFVRPSVVIWAAVFHGALVAAKVCYQVPMAVRGMPEMKINLLKACPWKELRGMVGFGGQNFLMGVGYLLYYATDSILIANLDELRPEQITDYNVAQRWAPLIGNLIISFTTVLTPVMTSDVAVGNFDRIRQTVLRATRYTLALALFPCIVLGMLAEPLLANWLGASFVQTSASEMRVIMVGFAVAVPGILGFEVLFSFARLGKAVAATIAGGVANVVLSIALVKFAGLDLMGLALGSAFSMAVVNGVCIPVLVCKYTGIGVADYLRQGYVRAWLAAAPLIGCCVLLRRFWEPSSLALVGLQFALCGVAYAVSVSVVVLSADERRRIRTLVRSRIERWKAAVGAGQGGADDGPCK